MEHVLNPILALRATKSRNAKLAILKENVGNTDLKEFLRLTYEPRINYYMSKVEPAFGKEVNEQARTQHANNATIKTYQRIAEVLNDRELTGHAARDFVADAYQELNDVQRELLVSMILRNIQAGTGISTINDVWPGLITDLPYMRCCSVKDIKFEDIDWAAGAYSQIKADGQFANVTHHHDGKVTIQTRNGSDFLLHNFKALTTQVRKQIPLGRQLHGEMLVIDSTGKVLPREEGNGHFNRMLSTGEDLPEGLTAIMVAWDMIPIESAVVKGKYEVAYKTRFNHLLDCLLTDAGDTPIIRPIEYKIVYSKKEAFEHFKEMLLRGEEGTVLKPAAGIWEDSDGSKWQIKMKLEFEVELLVTGFRDADETSKNKDMFGSMICESSCGRLRVGVTGLKDDKRKEIHDARDAWAGKMIITVKANSIMAPKKENDDLYSLFLPRFSIERLDKNQANSLEEIHGIYLAAIETA